MATSGDGGVGVTHQGRSGCRWTIEGSITRCPAEQTEFSGPGPLQPVRLLAPHFTQ